MSRPDLMAWAEQERTDLLELLRDLSDEEWQAPSLCTRWSVRDVATHVVSYDELSTPRLVATLVRGPAEPLLMAVAGRPDALDELAGPGLPTLRERVAG